MIDKLSKTYDQMKPIVVKFARSKKTKGAMLALAGVIWAVTKNPTAAAYIVGLVTTITTFDAASYADDPKGKLTAMIQANILASTVAALGGNLSPALLALVATTRTTHALVLLNKGKEMGKFEKMFYSTLFPVVGLLSWDGLKTILSMASKIIVTIGGSRTKRPLVMTRSTCIGNTIAAINFGLVMEGGLTQGIGHGITAVRAAVTARRERKEELIQKAEHEKRCKAHYQKEVVEKKKTIEQVREDQVAMRAAQNNIKSINDQIRIARKILKKDDGFLLTNRIANAIISRKER